MEGHEELVQSDHGENDAEAEGAIPDGSLNENEEGGAEEEAAAVATVIGLPEPDYDSAIESDCGSDDDFWQIFKVILVIPLHYQNDFFSQKYC